MTPNEKYQVAIDKATDAHRQKLTYSELRFLTSLGNVIKGGRILTLNQKTMAYPILKRVGVMQ